MSGLKKMCLFVLLGLGLVSSSVPVSANTIIVSFAPSSFEGPTPWRIINQLADYQFEVPKFNPALGTLQSIDFTLHGEVLSTVTITNKINYDVLPYSFRVGVNFTAWLPDDNIPLQVLNSSGLIIGDVAASGTVVLPGISGSDNAHKSRSTSLDAYIGTGNFIVPVEAKNYLMSTLLGDGTIGTDTTAKASLEVIYTYAPPIPLPASVWAGSVLLAGLVYRRFRRLAAE